MLGLNMGCVQCLENPPGEKKKKQTRNSVVNEETNSKLVSTKEKVEGKQGREM